MISMNVSMRAVRACRPLPVHQLLLLVSTWVFSTGTLAVEAFVDAALPGSVFAGVVPAPDGLLYGLTYDGGANGAGAIYSNNRSPTPALDTTIANREAMRQSVQIDSPVPFSFSGIRAHRAFAMP